MRDELLVFRSGYWDKSAKLFDSIQRSTLDTLVLADDIGQRIRSDFDRFFTSKELYHRYNIAWKRGVLFLGPPGNGKTHCIKALVNHLKRPCLYVQSFKSECASDQSNIETVFRRARETTPCILILEDLDSLLNDDNRSFFLNELDGFQRTKAS